MAQVPPHITDGQSSADEQAWILALGQSGEEAIEAFENIFRRYSSKLVQYVMPFLDDHLPDAKEVIQMVFLKLWEKRHRLVGIKHMDRYLFRMSRNATWDYKENMQTERRRILDIAARETAYFDVADMSIELRELEEEAIRALSLLPERRRLIFLAYTREDMSLEQIALAMNISKDVVKKQLHLATRFLKDYVASNAKRGHNIAFLLIFF